VGRLGIVKGVASPAHFDKDRIEIVLAAVAGEFFDFSGVEETRAEGVHPQAAKFGGEGKVSPKKAEDCQEHEAATHFAAAMATSYLYAEVMPPHTCLRHARGNMLHGRLSSTIKCLGHQGPKVSPGKSGRRTCASAAFPWR